MSVAPLRVAVVGHTNTGKTSLLRTLTRDVGFGEVSPRPGTTRHVAMTALLIGGTSAIELYDTPGLEDASALLERLERMGGHQDGIDRIRQFLETNAARTEFEQEAKVLRQVLASDLSLYVIDIRELVMGRHRDELTLLRYSARPVVPVLNFVASPEAREALWREHLARIGLHAVVAFDTVLFDAAGEQQLFEKMASLLHGREALLRALIEERRHAATDLRRSALMLVADLLLDVAALAMRAPAADAAELAERAEALRARVRTREQACVEQLVASFGFRREDFHDEGLAIVAGRWKQDPFAAETLRAFGISAGGGAVTGAALGLGIDVFTGFMSLGAAAALGATLGAVVATLRRHGGRALDALRGHALLRVDDDTLRLLASRQLQLVATLLRRGHASLAPVHLAAIPARSLWAGAALPTPLARARQNPPWSRLIDDAGDVEASGDRGSALADLSRQLGQWLTPV